MADIKDPLGILNETQTKDPLGILDTTVTETVTPVAETQPVTPAAQPTVTETPEITKVDPLTLTPTLGTPQAPTRTQLTTPKYDTVSLSKMLGTTPEALKSLAVKLPNTAAEIKATLKTTDAVAEQLLWYKKSISSYAPKSVIAEFNGYVWNDPSEQPTVKPKEISSAYTTTAPTNLEQIKPFEDALSTLPENVTLSQLETAILAANNSGQSAFGANWREDNALRAEDIYSLFPEGTQNITKEQAQQAVDILRVNKEKQAGSSFDKYVDKNLGADWEKIKKSYGGRQIESFAQSIQQIKNGVQGKSDDMSKNVTDVMAGGIGAIFSLIPGAQVFMATQEGIIQASNAMEAALLNDKTIFTENNGAANKVIDLAMTLPSKSLEHFGVVNKTEQGSTAENIVQFYDIVWQMILLHNTGKLISEIKGNPKGVYTASDLQKLSEQFKPLNSIADKVIKKEPLSKDDLEFVKKSAEEIVENPEYIKEAVEADPTLTKSEKQAVTDKIELDQQIAELSPETKLTKDSKPQELSNVVEEKPDTKVEKVSDVKVEKQSEAPTEEKPRGEVEETVKPKEVVAEESPVNLDENGKKGALKDVESTAKALEKSYNENKKKVESIIGTKRDKYGDIIEKYTDDEFEKELNYFENEIPKQDVWLATPYNQKHGYDLYDKLEYKNGEWSVGSNTFKTSRDAAWFLLKNAYVITGEKQITNKEASNLWDKKYGSLSEYGEIKLKSNLKFISEAYHKAKADGSNPELVKAVEDLLGEKSQVKGAENLTETNPAQPTVLGKEEIKAEETQVKGTDVQPKTEEPKVSKNIEELKKQLDVKTEELKKENPQFDAARNIEDYDIISETKEYNELLLAQLENKLKDAADGDYALKQNVREAIKETKDKLNKFKEEPNTKKITDVQPKTEFTESEQPKVVNTKTESVITEGKQNYGSKGETKFSSEVSMPFEYKLVEADELQASHLPSGERNPNHSIAKAQPKERNDAASKNAQDNIMKNPNFKELSESPNAYFGTPIVNEVGEVIQGNNRSIGIKKHYANKGERYKQDLMDNAESFGLTKEQVANMKNPVLVREIKVDDQTAVNLGNYDVKDLETGGKQRVDAVTVSRRMESKDKSALSSVIFGEDFKTVKESIRNNIAKITPLIKKYLNPAQISTMFNKNGDITAKGMEDIESVVNNFIFDKGDAILPEIFTEFSDVTQKGLQKSLRYIFGIEDAKSILKDTQNSLLALYKFKKSGIEKFDEWKNTADMFEGVTPKDVFSSLELELAKKLNEAKTQADITKIYKKHSELVSGVEANLLDPAIEGISKKDAIKEQFKIENYEDITTADVGTKNNQLVKEKVSSQKEVTAEKQPEPIKEPPKVEPKKEEPISTKSVESEGTSEGVKPLSTKTVEKPKGTKEKRKEEIAKTEEKIKERLEKANEHLSNSISKLVSNFGGKLDIMSDADRKSLTGEMWEAIKAYADVAGLTLKEAALKFRESLDEKFGKFYDENKKEIEKEVIKKTDTTLKRLEADKELEKMSGADALEKMKSILQTTDEQQAFEQAKKDVLSKSGLAEETTKRVLKTKSGTEADQAVILVELARLRDAESTLFEKLQGDPKNKELLSQKRNLEDKIYDNYTAGAILGRQSSNMFRLRKLFVDKTENLYRMEQEYMASEGLESLTKEQKQEVKKLYDEIKELRFKAEEADKRAEIATNEKIAMQSLLDAAKNKPKVTVERSIKKTILDDIKSAGKTIDQLIAQTHKDLFKTSYGQTSVNATVAQMAQMGKLVGLYIAKGNLKLTEAVAKVYETAKDHFSNITKEDIKRELDKYIESKRGNKMSRTLLEELVAEGNNTIEKLTDAVRKELKIDENTTDRQIRDEITNYGKQRKLSKEEIKTKLREIKRIGILTTKLEEARQKRRPLKTGTERDTPTKQERDMQKELNDLLKEIPLDEEAATNKLKTSLDGIKTRLKNSIEDLQKAIDNNEKIVRKNNKTEYDAEAEELLTQKEELQSEYDKIFGKNELTDEQKIKRTLDALIKSEEKIDKRIKALDFESKKTNKISTPEIEKQRELLKQKKEEFNKLKEDAGIAEKEWNDKKAKYYEKRANKYQKRLDNHDFETKQKPIKYEINEEQETAQNKYQAAKLKWEIARAKAQYANTHWAEKAIDKAIKFRTGVMLLSGIKSLGKIAMYSVMETAYGEHMDMLMSGLSKLIMPKLSEISATEGKFNIEARKEFYKTYFNRKTWGDAMSFLKSNSRTHSLYKKMSIGSPEASLNFGKIHGAEKYPLWKAEFNKQKMFLADHFYKQGYDISKRSVLETIEALAVDKANYKILMNKNILSSGLKGLQMRWMQNGSTTAKAAYYVSKVIFPIMSVPTNYAIKTARSWGGLVEFAGRAVQMATQKGKVTPEQADKALLAFKQGLPGLGLAILGASTMSVDENDDLYIFGIKIPKWMTHHPAIFTTKLFAKAKQEYEKENNITKEAFNIASETIKEVPYLGDRALEMIKSAKDFNNFTQNLILSFAEPQLVKDIASMTDKEKLTFYSFWMEDAPKRYVKTSGDISKYFSELIERAKLGIPGLRQDVKTIYVPHKKKSTEQKHTQTKHTNKPTILGN